MLAIFGPTGIGKTDVAVALAARLRERHVPADRERLGDREEAEQPVLEPRLLIGSRGAGQRRQALIDLHRVGRDRDRVLSACAQQFGDCDRHGGLADGVRAEERYDRRARRDSSPARVVLVALVIATRANSPGCATPLKFTVLL